MNTMSTHDFLFVLIYCLSALVFLLIGYISRDNSEMPGDYKETHRYWSDGYSVGRKYGYKEGVKDGKRKAARANGGDAVQRACREMHAVLSKLEDEQK